MPTSNPAVCLLAYDFSTKIMGGSVRAIKFAEYLPHYGWTPHVVTASPPEEHPALAEGSVTYIPSPERGFGGGIAVEQDGSGTLDQNPGWLQRLAAIKQFVPLERQITWFPAFRREVLRSLAGKDIRAVVSTSAPYVMMLFGRWLASRLGVPHLIDLRDDWQGRELYEERSWLNRTLLDAYCTYVAKRSAGVSVVSWYTQPRFQAMGVPTYLVPNGYDEPQFAHLPLEAQSVASEGPLRILHLGWMAAYRTIEPILTAFRTLRERHPGLADQLRLEQYGLIEASEQRLIDNSCVADMVEIHGQIPHAEAINTMADADVLLVIPGSRIPAALTGKLFEYLRVRRPILLLGRPGAAMELAERVNLRFRIDEHDQEAVTNAIADLLARKRSGTLRTDTLADRITPFAREHTTGVLAEALNRATGHATGSGDGHAPVPLKTMEVAR